MRGVGVRAKGRSSRSARGSCKAVGWLQAECQAAEGYGLLPETVCRPRGSILKTRTSGLPHSYMQKLHDLMPKPRKKPGKPGFFMDDLAAQAMNTAIKANRKIRTAPATGKTTGMW
jgi:hypothetical protein